MRTYLKYNDSVTVSSYDGGWAISVCLPNEGKALNPAYEGKVVKMRSTASKSTVITIYDQNGKTSTQSSNITNNPNLTYTGTVTHTAPPVNNYLIWIEEAK